MRPTPNHQNNDRPPPTSSDTSPSSILPTQNSENKEPWLKGENSVSENGSSSILDDLSSYYTDNEESKDKSSDVLSNSGIL